MTLIPIETPEDFLLAQQFIAPYEETCVSLASLIRRQSDKLIFLKSGKEIVGILNLDSTIYHCIPDINQIDKINLLENLPYLLKKTVRCISGEKRATEYLINFFPNPAQLYDYKMMKYPVETTATEQNRDTEISLSGGEEIIR